jgi:hypothetical protein
MNMVANPLGIPTYSVLEFQLLHTFASTWYCQFVLFLMLGIIKYV